MKKGRKKQVSISVRFFTVILLSALLVGCGAGSKDFAPAEEIAMDTGAGGFPTANIYGNEAVMEEIAEVDEAAAPESGAGNELMEDSLQTGPEEREASSRKLIKNVRLDVETEDYSALVSTVSSRTEELGGYIESRESYNENEIGWRSTHMTLRIPADSLDSFVSQMGEISNIVTREESVEDVTLQYVDLESHKRMLLEEQERLLTLLEQAETVEDIISIESRLTDVRYQLESMESQLRTMDNQVRYSTVRLYIREVERYTPPVEKGTWERIRTGFTENVYRVGRGIKEFFIGFVISLPMLLVFAIVVAVIALVLRALIRGVDKRNEKRRQLMHKQMAYGPGPGAGNIPGAPGNGNAPGTQGAGNAPGYAPAPANEPKNQTDKEN